MLFFGVSPLWGWLGFGLVLMAIEALIAPGSYLIWIGLAAFLMAGLSSFMVLSWIAELTTFGSLSLVCALIGWRVYGSGKAPHDAQDLNNPEEALLGRVVLLSSAIVNGVGQAKVGDSFWNVHGSDLPKGTKVQIRKLEGTTLIVEKTDAA